jgi:hypothetical protein
MSENQKKQLSKIKSFKIKQLDEKMNIVKIWDSAREASDFLNISISGIHNTVNENMPAKRAGGFKWEFINRKNKKYIQNG